MDDKNKMSLLLMAAVAVILLTGAFLSGFSLGTKQMKTVYESNCEDSRILQHLLEAGYLPPQFDPAQPLYELTGQVIKIGADSIKIEARPMFFSEPTIYTVLITSDTIIVKRKIKDKKLIEQELAIFDSALNTFNSELSEPSSESPMLYTEAKIDLSDLKVGQDVTVVTDANIREHLNFVARSITTILGTLDAVQPPPLPPMPDNLNKAATAD